MHLSVKLIFTLAGQMTTTGEETHTPAECGPLIGSHQLGITKSTCHPLGFSNPYGEAPATGASKARAKFTQTLHPHCQLDLVIFHKLGLLGLNHVCFHTVNIMIGASGQRLQDSIN